MTGFCTIARVSGLMLTVSNDPEGEINYQINQAMRRLYDFGCRRIVAAKRMTRTGDCEQYLVRGFIT